ncbi:MAG TPA: tyrosinase family protein [Candidatus Eremiobacteraceae bacterium]|nr:tyrosinase family protein [Candidatus Eremiobacteraceae bacterium]
MRPHISRANFVGMTGAATLTVLVQPGHGLRALGATVYVRRDVGGMSAADPAILAYRTAVRQMRALPPSDPRSWTYQAAIHGTFATPARPSWNTCEHGTYFFWSWHRMYLYWFERICRSMCGDDCWALPYWNWSSPAQRQLPATFRETSSELYTPNRDPAMNSGAGSLPATDVDYSGAFAFGDFTTADSVIQGTPHGDVHVDVGGWMGSVPTAAQDPIFYLHHCNIDRLWNLWLAQGGGRSDPTSDAAWRSKTFTFFNESGDPVTMTGCDVLRAAFQLGYLYEGEPAQVNQYCPPTFHLPPTYYLTETLVHLPIPPVTLGSKPSSFAVNLRDLRARLAPALASPHETLLLQLGDVEASSQPGAVWDVYFGLSKGAQPDPKSPFFVGTLSLFGTGIRSDRAHKFMPASFTFAIGKALKASFAARETQASVTFVPHGILIDGRPSRPTVRSTVRIGEASIAVQTGRRRTG